ncbi:MAG: triacylglycerol lipase [Aquabacterium sp.]|jgi:triacylglycerol lipase|uniref:esterase/lipase family protein n=1 Tax=Aquabacterium sp. TaxID=1872578 RepID=UPI002A360FF8|nr:triacylglycerol lipase [Aquabacterium sp.]MDX9842577.1 triacylglycerol lipase [Aquabacterium sp.]
MTLSLLRRGLTALLLLATLSVAQAGTTAQTRHPIVLVHGFMGFNTVLGIPYWYKIPEALRKEGATVYIASVNPAQTTEYRGEELIRQLQQWAARDGAQKFNLIGHSHGGPTVRYAAGVMPAMVASVTTVAGANFGSQVADQLEANMTPGALFEQTATTLAKLISFLNGTPSTSDVNLRDAVDSLSATGLAKFNARFPAGAPTTPCGSGPEVAAVDGHPIRWYSVSGTSVKTNFWDISDALLDTFASQYFTEAHDGLVGRCASHWGKVLKDNYDWNHLDEINQVFGLVGRNAPSPLAFYVQHANRLKQVGL